MAHQWNEQLGASEPYGGLPGWLGGTRLSREELERARPWSIAFGVLALIAGALSILVPAVTSVTMTVFIGWLVLIYGLATAGHAISHRSPLRGLEALLSVIAGLYLLIFPLSGTVTLTFLLAVWLFATGVVALFGALQAGHVPGRALAGFAGALSVLLGLLVAFELPSSAAWAIGLLVGVNLLAWGIRTVVAASVLPRRLGEG